MTPSYTTSPDATVLIAVSWQTLVTVLLLLAKTRVLNHRANVGVV